MPLEFIYDFTNAVKPGGRPVSLAIDPPRDSDFDIVCNGVPADATLWLAVSVTAGADPIYDKLGTANRIRVPADDIGEKIDENAQYRCNITIEDPDGFSIRDVSSKFLGTGTLQQTESIRPSIENFNTALLSDATLPIQLLTRMQYDALASYQPGRPYLIYDFDADPPFMRDGTLPIVAVYMGTTVRYANGVSYPPDPAQPGGGSLGDGPAIDPGSEW